MKNIMNRIFLVLILALTFTVSKAKVKEITAEVVFENLTEKELKFGGFLVTNFQITLPRNGKYQFGFSTEEFTAYTIYAARITKKNKIITIRLMEEKETPSNVILSSPKYLNKDLSEEQIKKLIDEGKVNFIPQGIDNSVPTGYESFKKKYGIGVLKENCVVDPLSFERATVNNQIISDYLNKKYGEGWLNEMPAKPLGVK
jgi:hypothetical protein